MFREDIAVINAQFIKTAWDQCHHVVDVNELQTLYSQRDVNYPTAWDTETTGLHYGVPNVYMEAGDIVSEQDYPVVFGISMAWIVASEYVSEGNGVCVAWGRRPDRLFEAMVTLLADDSEKCWHNSKYDTRVCEANGIDVGGTQHCTYVKSRINWDRRRSHGLKQLTEFLAPQLSCWDDPVKAELKRLRAKWTRWRKCQTEYENDWVNWPSKVDFANFSFVDDVMMAEYAGVDSFMCLMLWLVLAERAVWS